MYYGIPAHLQAAVAKQHLRMNKEAVIDAQKAIEIDSSYSDAYITLGLILLNLDRTNEGCVVLRKATQLGNKKAFEYISEG